MKKILKGHTKLINFLFLIALLINGVCIFHYWKKTIIHCFIFMQNSNICLAEGASVMCWPIDTDSGHSDLSSADIGALH